MGQSFSDLIGVEYEEAALAPPAGVTSDFDHPPSNNTIAWVAYTLMIVVSIVSLLLRAYSRYLHGRIWVEDVLLLLGFVRSKAKFPDALALE